MHYVLQLIIIASIIPSPGADTPSLNNTRTIHTTQSNDPKDINFWVFNDINDSTIYKTLKVGSKASLKQSGLKPGPVFLFVSGFNSPNIESQLLKDAHHSSGKSNLIIVDWSKLAQSKLPVPLAFASYFEACNNVGKVGMKGSLLLKFLHDNSILPNFGEVQCLGTSLGAHVCGSIGWHTWKLTGNKVGRVTGLDPAGPFNKILKENKLNKKDAVFVDAIHSDIDGFGSPEQFGHADFYINGGKGKHQPGCEWLDPITTIFCAHPAALKLYVNTIEGKIYKGCRCKGKPSKIGKILVPCEKPKVCTDASVAGEMSSFKTRGKFYVETQDNLVVDEQLNAIIAVENNPVFTEIRDQVLAIIGGKFTG